MTSNEGSVFTEMDGIGVVGPSDAPKHFDYFGRLLRAVELTDGRTTWHVTTWDAHVVDHAGKSGVAVVVDQDGRVVYETGLRADGLVYVGAGTAIDSDRAVASCITLCCHDAYGLNELVEPDWDAYGLNEQRAMLGAKS